MVISGNIQTAIKPKSHPLKIEIKKQDLRLWQIRKLLGGSPSEGQLSRYLNGIDKMPLNLEVRLNEVINEISNGRRS